jgi:hypothetical protein
MRKFPIYNLAQEITMQMMMVLVIVGYISYDQLDVIGTIGYGLIGVAVIGVLLLFTRQIKNMAIAKIIGQTKHKKFRVVKINWMLIVASNLVIIGLSLFHFYIWLRQGKDLGPLYNEYGIGALLGIGMLVLNSRDFSITTTDKGIAFGSKFDIKLLQWADIKSVTQEEQNLIITPKNKIGFKSLKIPLAAVSIELESLIKMNNISTN